METINLVYVYHIYRSVSVMSFNLMYVYFFFLIWNQSHQGFPRYSSDIHKCGINDLEVYNE